MTILAPKLGELRRLNKGTEVIMERNTFHDLRTFLAYLKKNGQVQEINTRVDKTWEVGAICRENLDRDGPALIFNHVDDFRTPLVVGVLSTVQRYAAALRVPAKTSAFVEIWRNAYSNPIKPVQVQNAPCKEVKAVDIDLLRDPFPVPIWHPLDAGPELGTLHAVITKDPETGWTNLGTYRNEIFNKNTVGCYVAPNRHIGLHWHKWKKLGKPMPAAIAIGLAPTLCMTAVSAVPADVSEYDVAGGLQGSPIEVVEAETSDLLVPAHAEIIIEGEIPIDEFWPEEAPFGEFTGYMGMKRYDSQFMNVRCVTHRRDPYFQGTHEGRPPSESTMLRCVGRSAAMYEHLKRAGIPGILDVCVTPGSCAGFHCVVAIEKRYPGHVRDVFGHVWGQPTLFCKHVTVVDPDIDPWNPVQVEWATSTRVQADRDVEIVKGGKSIALDPSQVPSLRGLSALMGVDATKPLDEYARDKTEEFPASTDPLPESVARVRERWREYGFI
ncbi:MAG: UbiD family decarboxylase [Chloroflexi bacterium]|nr:UbiD family decarboxylase [Chloroflexota bacterium]